MGEYLKMADVFGGAVTANHGDDNNGWSTVDTSLGLSIDESGDGGFKAKTADYVAHAINYHDELVAEVERLRRQLACAFMAGWEEGINGMECDEAEVASVEIAEQFSRN